MYLVNKLLIEHDIRPLSDEPTVNSLLSVLSNRDETVHNEKLTEIVLDISDIERVIRQLRGTGSVGLSNNILKKLSENLKLCWFGYSTHP
jgi:hypothetical protein